MACVQHQVGIGLEEVRRQWFAVAHTAIAQISVNGVNGQQLYPFLPLGLVGGNLAIELLRHPVQGDAPLDFQNEFLLQPELFLEVFKLGQEVNELVPHMAGGAHAHQPTAEPVGVPQGQVLQVQHVGFEVQVQLPPQKAAQILVDEVIKAVLGRVTPNMFGQHGPCRVRLSGCQSGQRQLPFPIQRPENPAR